MPLQFSHSANLESMQWARYLNSFSLHQVIKRLDKFHYYLGLAPQMEAYTSLQFRFTLH